jgi:NTE family protein
MGYNKSGDNMIGLVLEGGGTKGAYQIGAIRAILENNIQIGAITGTSIGALNGAMIVSGNFDKMYDLWYNIDYKNLFDNSLEVISNIKLNENLFKDPNLLMKEFREAFRKGGLDITPLKELIDKYIDEDKIRNSNIRFGLVTYSLTDKAPLELFIEDIPKGKLNEYLLASSNLPVFKQEKYDGKILIDGGFYDNLPVNLMLKDCNINEIWTIETSGVGLKQKYDSLIPIKRIRPSSDTGRTLNFDINKARNNLQMGYWDFQRFYNKNFGIKYCIKPFDENRGLNFLLNIEENDVLILEEILGLNLEGSKRSLLENCIRKISSIYKLDDSKLNYAHFLVNLLEYLAYDFEVDRFKLYDIDELRKSIIENSKIIHKGKRRTRLKRVNKLLAEGKIYIGSNIEELSLKLVETIFKYEI